MRNHSQCFLILKNTLTGTVPIPNEICPDGVSWSDCSPDLFELIANEHDITHVSCFIINPRGCRKHPINIARIAFKGQDLPDRVYIGGTFYKVKPYIPPCCQCQNCWRFGHPAKYGHIRTNCPSTIRICANCTQEHNVFFQGCPIYTFASEVAALKCLLVQTWPKSQRSPSLWLPTGSSLSAHLH